MPYKFSRRQTQPYMKRSGKSIIHFHSKHRHAAARVLQSAWRKRKRVVLRNPRSSGIVKSSRSLNAPNTNRFSGRNLIEGHHNPMSRIGYSVLKGLNNAGVIEKRLIAHKQVDYAAPSPIAIDNPKLKSMSAAVVQYSNTEQDSVSNQPAYGITEIAKVGAFQISNTNSRDKYVFYKNFQTEITINTEVAKFATVPDPTESLTLGYCNTLNFRVLLIKKKPGQISAPTGGAPETEANFSNSLFLGYDGNPVGTSNVLGYTGTIAQKLVTGQDVLGRKINSKYWQVLQDKRFNLTVPVPNTAGTEGKYPAYKRLVFKHPIMEKVNVSTSQAGTRPLDWDDQYLCLILAGLPNSSAAVLSDAGGTGVVVPETTKLWRYSVRGFTSYMDA